MNKQTVTLETFCEGAKQLLSIEAALSGEAVSQEWTKKSPYGRWGSLELSLWGK